MTFAAIVWLIVGAVFCIIEGATVALISIWMAIAAFLSAVVAFLGGSLLTQILVFLFVSAILMVATIPVSRKFRGKKKEKTNADRVIGEEAVVIEKIDPIENKGKVKVMGQIWSASSLNRSCIDVGVKVKISSIEGVRVVVEE